MSVYSVIPIKRPRRSLFYLNHPVNTSCNIGELIPTCRPIECVPGDTFDVSQVATCELMPMIKPAKGNLWLESWCFFVSNDMLKINSDSGKFTEILLSAQNPRDVLSLPKIIGQNNSPWFSLGHILDYLGYPVGVGTNVSGLSLTPYPVRGYFKIFDEYFRDENLQSETFTPLYGVPVDGAIQLVNYKKDRFTSAFTSEQKGSPISLGLGTSAPVTITTKMLQNGTLYDGSFITVPPKNTELNAFSVGYQTQDGTITGDIPYGDIQFNATADLSSATAVTINDLRLANKLQKWSERIQLAGSRPKEYLLANYGICPNDETLQRPVLIGHIKTPVIIDSVVQNIPTSGSVASTKSGNGYTVSKTRFGKWTCKEFGWIYVLSALRPDSVYTQGIHRSLIKNNIYDFFNPVFESLGQQEILNAELFARNTLADKEIWGFTDRYNEYRAMEGMTTGALRANVQESLDPWVIQRKFAELPTLSSSFIQVNPSEYDYLFNFQHSESRPQAILHCANFIKAIRPISKYAHPSL